MITKVTSADYEIYKNLVLEFYSTDAVLHPIPECYIKNTFLEFTNRSDYAKAFFIKTKENTIAGYALLAITFSQEAGGKTVWLEELYIKPEFRNFGLGSEFFTFLAETEKDCKRFRLEVEDYNKKAIELYKRKGFSFLPYSQMIKEQ